MFTQGCRAKETASSSFSNIQILIQSENIFVFNGLYVVVFVDYCRLAQNTVDILYKRDVRVEFTLARYWVTDLCLLNAGTALAFICEPKRSVTGLGNLIIDTYRI